MKVKSKYLCISISFICCWFMLSGGGKGLLCFLENRRRSDLEGIKVISHFSPISVSYPSQN